MKKKILKVLFVLATIDILDILSKGCVIGWMKKWHSDAYNDLMDYTMFSKYNPERLRAKMMDAAAKLWVWISLKAEEKIESQK